MKMIEIIPTEKNYQKHMITLNKLITNSIKRSLMTFFVILMHAGCQIQGSLVLPKDETTAATILENKGYGINYLKFKPGDQIYKVKMKATTRYEKGDLAAICKITTLKFLRFEGISFPELSNDDINSCANSNVNQLDFATIKSENHSLCKLLQLKKKPELILLFSNTRINRSLMECISDIKILSDFGMDGYLDITDEDFCSFSNKSKNLKFLRINESNLGKKSLECILNFTKLTSVMLQDWKNVPMAEHFKIMDAYEKKYGRKIEKLINDTY